MRIVYFGTSGELTLLPLRALVEAYTVVAVVRPRVSHRRVRHGLGRLARTLGFRPPDPIESFLRTRHIPTFLLYCLGVSFGVILTRHDLWPFASWPLVSALVPTTIPVTHLLAVDQQDQEHDIDYRAWQPLALVDLISWMRLHFPRLDSAAQARVGRYLLHLAETARQRGQAGMRVGYFRHYPE